MPRQKDQSRIIKTALRELACEDFAYDLSFWPRVCDNKYNKPKDKKSSQLAEKWILRHVDLSVPWFAIVELYGLYEGMYV